MGDIADGVIAGFLCQECLSPMADHDSPGYPRTCSQCRKEATNQRPQFITYKVKCPVCDKKVKGLADHHRDVHGVKK